MKKVLKGLLVLVIVGAGIGIYLFLKYTQPIPPKHAAEEMSTVVEVIEAKETQEAVRVSAMGTVVPARTVTVYPEVAGRIIYQSKKLVPGGRFTKGQTLVRIDPRDYDLAIKQQQARVVQAGAELAREKGLKSVAEREWSLIRDEVQPTEEGKKLALREIQLENAQAMVASAKSALEQAELMRDRTSITAPFNSLVTEEFVDVGQVVAGGSRIATLVDSDRFWVRTSVPVDRLSWIHIPGVNADEGSAARVVLQAGPDLTVERDGRVVKLLSNLDPKGKMARLLVEVDHPLGSGQDNGNSMPLLLDAYVTVLIEGARVQNAIELPRMALQENDRVWVKTPEGRLSIRKVQVVWAKNEQVFLNGDLKAGEKVVTSRIAAPVEGMQLREVGEKPKGDPKKPDPGAKPETS